MTLFSTRAKEATKTGLAMAIAYGIALQMDWDKPYWAGFAVAMISLSSAGQSLNKAALRMGGTLVAAVVALTLIALFPQERWWFLIALSVWVGFCTYMMTGKQHPYLWQVSAFVCLIIAVDGGPDSTHAFEIAVERTQETAMGILVYSLVAALLWPRGSSGELDSASQTLVQTQRALFQAYRRLMMGQADPADSRALWAQEVQLVPLIEQTLMAAKTETYEVWEVRAQWRRFVQLTTRVAETLERWRESFPEVSRLDPTLLPNLRALCDEINLRFDQIERMLGGAPPARLPQAITLAIDTERLHRLSHFDKAALASAKAQLDSLGQESRSLFACVHDLRGYGRLDDDAATGEISAGEPTFDPDRFAAAVSVVATLWSAFLIWVYVDPPGHASFVQLAPTMAFAVARAPMVPASSMLLPFAMGSVFAGVLYVFVMPQLSSYWELGLMIFAATFVIYYVFWRPQQGLAKFGGIVPFIVFTSIQNQQSYDFATFANSAAMLMLALLLVVATTYVPTSPRPEKAFLRLLRRFFRQGESLIARLDSDWQQNRGLRRRWHTPLNTNAPLELPGKLRAWGRHINQARFPDTPPERVEDFVTSLQAIAFRLKELVDAARYPQADLLRHALRDDVRHWRIAIELLLRRWSESAPTDPSNVLEARLDAQLTKMERRIDETLDVAARGQLREQDYENFYRLLGAYRGLSEAVVDHARIAVDMDMAHWREARF